MILGGRLRRVPGLSNVNHHHQNSWLVHEVLELMPTVVLTMAIYRWRRVRHEPEKEMEDPELPRELPEVEPDGVR